MNLLQHTSGLVSISVKKPFAVLCSSFLNHPALLQRHVITSGQVPRWYKLCSTLLSKYPYLGQCPWYKSPLQLTFWPVSIWWHTTGQCPHALQESFAAHFWTGVHMVAHDGPVPTCITRILCSSFLDRCPYGGTRWASAHMHYKNPLQLSCMWTGVHMVANDGPVPTLQESFVAHFWTGVHMVAHLYQCPNDIGDLCNTLLGRCPGVTCELVSSC